MVNQEQKCIWIISQLWLSPSFPLSDSALWVVGRGPVPSVVGPRGEQEP